MLLIGNKLLVSTEVNTEILILAILRSFFPTGSIRTEQLDFERARRKPVLLLPRDDKKVHRTVAKLRILHPLLQLRWYNEFDDRYERNFGHRDVHMVRPLRR